MSATLREMRWTDIPTLAALDEELFAQDAWREETWWAELAARPRRAYAVLTGGEGVPGGDVDGGGDGTDGSGGGKGVLGYAGADLGGEVADVMTIAVAPGAQGGGHGRTLLAWLEETARADGAEHLMLEVRADNAAAIGLYERSGFVRIDVRRRYYQPGDVDALIMRKDLRS